MPTPLSTVHLEPPVSALTPVTEPPKKKRRPHHKKRPVRREATATPTPRPHRHLRRRTHSKKRPTPTPTATPTATPPINLTTEDSISPVACNGPRKPPATRPFLSPPFTGWTSLVSYFDHDMPDFYQDGLIVTATGMQAQPDAAHHAADFPAYWNPQLRQYINYDGHNGYDYNLWYQPVLAAAAGKVIFAAFEYPDAPDHGYGKMVMVDHRNGYITLYGHFDRILVKRGQRVKRGQVLGISGNTGHSTGPHLHFTVFHDCSPVDPYGWSGPGTDPLATYKGETSTYLWRTPPLVTNPPPGWPGIGTLPPTSEVRYLLVQLPPTSGGTGSFTRALRHELHRLRALLGPAGKGARIEMVRGALRLDSSASAQQLYALPFVASIASPDAAGDARADVLAALARAALSDHLRLLHLNRSHTWTGAVVQWEGRTYLIGRGQKGQRVKLRIPKGASEIVRKIQADPGSGAYAVDLGTMTRRQIALLTRELQGPSRHLQAVTVRSAGHGGPLAAPTGTTQTPPFLALVLFLCLAAGMLAALCYAVVSQRRPAEPH